MEAPRFVFTISPGRSGQASLSEALAAALPDYFVAFEEPQLRPVLPGALGDVERRLRRRFVETHELMGRGKVLDAFDRGDQAALQAYARARMDWVDRRMARMGARNYADVSKHFLHGLHGPTIGMLLERGIRPSFIRLVRDPVQNMRSYVNRRKRVSLDYGRTDGPHNVLVMDPATLTPGQFYLHAWCETYLRGARLLAETGLGPAVEIATPDLSRPGAVDALLDRLGLDHKPAPALPPRNTNAGAGHGETRPTPKDIEDFMRFRDRLLPDQLSQLPLPQDYDPAIGLYGAQGQG